MRFVFLGPPGAGKGTQGDMISEKYEIPKISTGDILREAINNQTEIGVKAEKYVKKGELVPDSIVFEMVKHRLQMDDVKKGFIFDGFPRNIKQAKFLDDLLSDLNMPIDKVLYINVDEEKLINRLSSRRVCKSCGKVYNLITSPPEVDGKCDDDGGELYQRQDDKKEVITNRLKVYHRLTKPLIDYYDNKDILVTVDGTESIDEINNRIKEVLF